MHYRQQYSSNPSSSNSTTWKCAESAATRAEGPAAWLLRRDGNGGIARVVERLADEPIALCLIHEPGHGGKSGLVAFRHRDRNADLLECPVGDARARHLLHISRQRVARERERIRLAVAQHRDRLRNG